MTPQIRTLVDTARRTTILATSLLATATGTVAAHGSGTYSGGMMGSGSWGLFGGTMGLWGLLVLGVLLASPLLVLYAASNRRVEGNENGPISVLQARYARGELSDDEYERRRERLEQTD
jgi:putative membrane protein